MFSDLRFRLRAVFRRAAVEQELDEELRAHIDRETEKYVRQGMAFDDAVRRARLAFGGVERIKEDARDARGVAALDAISQDLHYAWRGLRAQPGFTAAIILALGLGIGVNTAMFGIVDRLLFRPPPFLANPDRVHRIFTRYQWNGEMRTEGGLAFTRVAELSQAASFDNYAVLSDRRMAIGVGLEAREVPVAAVSASLFEFFDVQPVIGRFFTRQEDRTPSGALVAVLGYGFWQAHFGGRADAVGAPLHIGTSVYTIVGVAPQEFVGFSEQVVPAVFVPVTTVAYARAKDYFQNYNWSWLSMYARRKVGVRHEAAATELTEWFQRSWEAERALAGRESFPTASAAQASALVAPFQLARGPDAGPESKVAAWVMGVAAIVLLVACANVANLLLARAVRRRREIALRLALGVTRRRLLQQLLTESLLLATLGGAAGFALSLWGARVFRTLYGGRTGDPGSAVDGRTLLFVTLTTLVVALTTGLAPALSTIRGDVVRALRGGARDGSYRRSRARTALLLFQGALSLALLVGAGLFVRSLMNVRAMRMGYDVDPILYVEGNMRGVEVTRAEGAALGERMVSAASSIPGVESASLATSIPFYGNEGRGTPFVPRGDMDRIRRQGPFILQAGSPRYFETIGTRILRGRGFTAADRAGSAPVVVVSDAMAKTLWPGEDALGRQLRIGDDTMPLLTVVGVTEDMHGRRMTQKPENWYYLPVEQYLTTVGGPPNGLFVRVAGRAEDYVTVVRRRLQAEMPGAAYVTAVPLRSLVAPTRRSWEFGATMFLAFGGLALVLAAIGLYSMIAYSVAQRAQEFGVRMALGASSGHVMRMIVGSSVSFAAAGIAVGSLIALWAGRWLEPMLFAQKARDPLVFSGAAAVLFLVAIAAALQPARRATRANPTEALRSD